MHPAQKTLIVFLQIVGGIVLYSGLGMILEIAGPAIGIFCATLGVLGNVWAVYAFVRYRQGRQDELARVLTAAVNAGAPLGQAVASYRNDRPGRGTVRKTFEIASYIVFPLYGYVRLCVGTSRFDRLVELLAKRLDAGQSLSSALHSVPGVASRAFRLAAAVGESTGSLGTCLRSASDERSNAAWFEVGSRIAYPFAVLFFVGLTTIVILVKVIPKFKRIFEDFNEKLPAVTQYFVAAYSWISDFSFLLLLAALLGLIALAALIASPTARWRTPFLGRLYRWTVQAEILRALGLLLAAGRTVPAALEFLRSSRDLPLVVRRKLSLASVSVERGDSLDGALEQSGLLPDTMAPLVRAAERTRTLPWAVRELGDHLAGRALRLMRRASMVVAPLMILAVGSLVAFTALSVFMPIIRLMWSIE